MTDRAAPTGLRIAEALSYVCRRRDELAALLVGNDAALHALEAAAGRPAVDDALLAGFLNTLHKAVRQAGDPFGVYGGTGRSVTPAGVRDLDIVYRCPLRLCTGRSGDEVDGDVPHCRFAPPGTALIRERLP
ncbi:hypothetical protein ACM01_42600 [Streptomyces viridochromogenes]|uniref:Uncharacterized protein n=1 Tax=Streptomyces viridochromogenes TaxID=1938 RepID=A0A0J7YVE1_STRVR|nr:hypothetical protein [Streptomyces viridochromogenes]KMS67489.1 hypothetical protein ACM01_42600 [Streptomyces viridochromogenes]KOG06808.1 hypothetical protein ADK36_45400 [Streptomyces viridochromogenes]KOG29057.1 hypothetical protein ADK35_02740 [Streptomyces viridochromogenes]